MALDREAMWGRWRGCGHAFSREPMELLRQKVSGAIENQVHWLPGAGLRSEDRIALFSTFILMAAGRLAAVTSRARAAAAMRRLADLVERGAFNEDHL